VQFVGNGVLTEPQERLHFGLWAIAKSPLVIGADLDRIPESSLKILSNKVRFPPTPAGD
jgi:alpha-galactosidase